MKKLVIIGLLLAALLIGWGLGERQPAWGQSPLPVDWSPLSPVYLPVVVTNWDGTYPPLPKHRGVGHDLKWEENEASWLCLSLTTVGTSWYYDWTPYPIQCPGIEAIPMIWDETQIKVPVQGNSDWILVFNEPEPYLHQAELIPLEGAQYYRQVEQLYPDAKLVSPAVVYLDWMASFWSEYRNLYGEDPRVDALAFHLYPQLAQYYSTPANHIQKSTDKLDQAIAFADSHDIPEVWVTEFAAQPVAYGTLGYTGTIQYMEGMIEVFESRPEVTRWAWFGLDLTGFWYWPDHPELSALYDTSLSHGGVLTPLGEEYGDAYP